MLKDLKVIRCGKLIDGNGGQPAKDILVVIKGTRIIDIGDESSIDLSEEALEYDYPDKTVIPGLIDTHLHFALGPGETYEEQFQWSDGVQLASGVVNAQFTLESGVTTARDLGARNQVALDLREAAEKKIIQAPRLLVCGRSITMTGGHFYFCNAVADGYDGVRSITRQLLKEDVDFIKIMTSGGGTKGTRREYASYSVDEIKAAVDVAHGQGKTVTAHCHATQAIVNAIDAGVDEIEHCSFLEPYHEGYRSVFQEDIAKEIVEKEIYVDNVLSFSQHRFKSSLRNFRRLREFGAKILPGTDGLRLYDTANLSLMLEIMVRGGMTPMEAIVSATRTSAGACGLLDVVGTVEKGKEADLVILDEDPLKDIKTLRKPNLVIKGGKTVNPSGRCEANRKREDLSERIRKSLNMLKI